jgi:hypothetical protein
MTKSGGRRTLKVSLQHEKSGEMQKLILYHLSEFSRLLAICAP